MNIPVDKNNHAIDALRYTYSEQFLKIEEEDFDLRKAGIWV